MKEFFVFVFVFFSLTDWSEIGDAEVTLVALEHVATRRTLDIHREPNAALRKKKKEKRLSKMTAWQHRAFVRVPERRRWIPAARTSSQTRSGRPARLAAELTSRTTLTSQVHFPQRIAMYRWAYRHQSYWRPCWSCFCCRRRCELHNRFSKRGHLETNVKLSTHTYA